jgi:Histidine kinase-, DNA gyrase B-, and HSP90-like ATPase
MQPTAPARRLRGRFVRCAAPRLQSSHQLSRCWRQRLGCCRGCVVAGFGTALIDACNLRPHIFERFYRGEVSRSGVSTGLGLAIAKELIEAQGSAISVKSQLGQGSVFTVKLPRASHAS